jgi:transcriptional regulator of acetoin/glycerol metabolism
MPDQTTRHTERNAQKAHGLMRQTGRPPAGLIPALIESSWRRCLEHGPRFESRPEFDPCRRDDLDLMRQRNKALIDHALPIMETLYEQIANTQSMVVLSDANGYILHSLGDDDFLARAQRVALAPGVEWSECSRGTNAIGTALAEKSPVVVHGAQHFLPANHFLTCSAAPLRDPYGRVVGALDVSGDYRRFSPHTLALANMSAKMIENHLFCHAFPDAFVVRLHARPEFLGTLCEGLAAFREDGCLLSVNQSGAFQFGLGESGRYGHGFESLFGLPLSAALDRAARAAPSPCPLLLHTGIRVFVRIDSPRRPIHRSGPAPGEASRVPAGLDERQLLHEVRIAAESGASLLIEYEDKACGESLAQCLRLHLGRKANWVELDCDNTAVRFAHVLSRLGQRAGAESGPGEEVIFLGNVHKLNPAEQARLVSALQQGASPTGRAYNRVLIATCQGKLKRLALHKTFRSDLYHRLSERVFSLRNETGHSAAIGTDLDSITRQAIETALQAADGNVSAAARRLGISRSTLYRRLRSL